MTHCQLNTYGKLFGLNRSQIVVAISALPTYIIKHMFKSQLASLLIFTNLTILLLTANFYLTPIPIQTHCLSSAVYSPQSSDEELTQGIVVDCVACHHSYSSYLFETRVMDTLGILIPLRSQQQKSLNTNQAFQFIGSNQNNQSKEQLAHKEIVLIQRQAKQIQCQDLQKLDDFQLNQTQKGKLAASAWNKIQSVTFQQSSLLGLQLLNRNTDSAHYKIISSKLPVEPQQYSLALRLRYKVVSELSEEDEPIFLLYSLQENIVTRILLLSPLLLSLHRVLAHLSTHHQLLKTIVALVILSGCLSQLFTILVAILSCYLIFAQLLAKRILGVAISVLFATATVALKYQLISILPFSLLTFATTFVIFRTSAKPGSTLQSIVTIISITITILLGLALDWSTLVLVTPIQYLSYTLCEGQHKKEAKSSSYSGVHSQELQQQQDMVVRIERELAHK